MAKILLVEDDKSLREIYGVRLMAEGYEIVSAGDGEEALAMAIKERPDLIVSDVMMPKISGFDMLDILRSTSETKDVKVIMMTALSSDDQRARGEALGADRYLVKSQVGIEDVVRTVHDVLGDGVGAPTAAAPAPATPEPTAPAPLPTPAAFEPPVAQAAPAIPDPTPAPVAPPAPIAPEPVAAPAPDPSYAAPAPDPAYAAPAPDTAYAAPEPVAPAPVEAPAPYTPPAPVAPEPAPAPVFAPAPAAPVAPAPSTTLSELPVGPAPATMPQPTAPFSSPAPASLGERVIEPISDMSAVGDPADISSQIQQALNDPSAVQLPGQGNPPVPPVA